MNTLEELQWKTESWQAEQRKLVELGIERGWIIPPTIDTAMPKTNAPATKCAAKKSRRHARNEQNGVLT